MLHAEATSASTMLRCPSCGGALLLDQSEGRCSSCDTAYPHQDGILSFAEESTTFGEFTAAEMAEIIDFARTNGWRKALTDHVSSTRPDVVDLVLDPRRSNFREIIPLTGRETVLDYGCGFGGISLQIAQECHQVIALDSSRERLQFLRVAADQENISNIVTIHAMDPLRLPLADESLDVVVLVGVFEYLPASLMQFPVVEAQARVLSELRRVLKKGGKIYLGTKNRFGWNYMAGARDHNGLRFGPVLPRTVANTVTQARAGRPYRIIVDSLPGYRRLFREAGFGDIKAYWPVPGYQMPDSFVSLADGSAAADTSWQANYRGFRKAVLPLLSNAGLLKYFVPFFSITATKK